MVVHRARPLQRVALTAATVAIPRPAMRFMSKRISRVPSCAEAQKCLFVSPLFATLTHSLSRKSFPWHSYANTRDGGATLLPISAHSSNNPISHTLCFHGLTNPFSRNPFNFKTICVALTIVVYTFLFATVPQWQVSRRVILFLGIAARKA